ncbi:hypothetical protein ACHAW5_000165 [Stephanodiscus triporus]|uniref:Glutaredoxin domain-containing protein n=1 Tax=Stephanodiscus triporus TaxID=2934178 RepID=A0ABD3NY03_9STRA
MAPSLLPRHSSSFPSIFRIRTACAAAVVIVAMMMRSSSGAAVAAAAAADASSAAVRRPPPPAVAFLRRKRAYTPLLFFKVPKGTMDECDGMEKVIKTVEKERGVRVERLDIMRDRAARKLYEKLVEGDIRSPFPLLYHRESLQRVYGVADVDLVRSWSKGRLLPDRGDDVVDGERMSVLGGQGGEEDEEMEMDMEELEMEMDAELTPVQRRGKEAMKRRMEEGRKK